MAHPPDLYLAPPSPGSSGPRPRAEGAPRPIPARLATALQRAHAAELKAVGDQRRPAFRLTRSLLGGARLAGYSTVLLAEYLGVSVTSIRTRGGSDGWITAAVFTRLTGLPASTVDHWMAGGMLPRHDIDVTGEQCYPASDLIRALGRLKPGSPGR